MPERFQGCFKARALIASSVPENTPRQARPPHLQILANHRHNFSPNGCWKLQRVHPDGFWIQGIFPELFPFFLSATLFEEGGAWFYVPVFLPTHLSSVLVFSPNEQIRLFCPCSFLWVFLSGARQSHPTCQRSRITWHSSIFSLR